MQPVSVILASTLMLGGMSVAYAQDGPSKKEGGPAQAQEQQAPGGGANSESKGDRGGSAKSGSSAERSGGERGNRQQAQDDGRGQKDGDRASKQDDDGKSAERSGKDQDKSKRAQSKEDDPSSRRADKDDQSEDAKRAGTDRDRAKDDTKRAETRDGKSKHVELKGDREDRVRKVFRERADVKERTDVDIDIHIGTSLPRDWDYYPVPAAVIDIVPEYRDYRFVYVENRYVIVNPTTYEVVTVIDTSGRTYAGGGGAVGGGSDGCSTNLSLSDDDREYLLRTVQMQNVDVGNVTIGMDVPGSVELRTFPDSVVDRVSILGSCRYFVTGDRIAIVDPNQHEVVILVD